MTLFHARFCVPSQPLAEASTRPETLQPGALP